MSQQRWLRDWSCVRLTGRVKISHKQNLPLYILLGGIFVPSFTSNGFHEMLNRTVEPNHASTVVLLGTQPAGFN